MGSFVARFLTNSPGLGEDLFFSVLGQLPARWGEVMWGLFTQSGDLLPGKTPREVAGSFWCLVGTKWEVLILALLTTPRQVGGTWWELGGEHFCLGKSEAKK